MQLLESRIRCFLFGAAFSCATLALGAQSQDPAEAAQRGIDWLLPGICSWTEEGGFAAIDCTTSQTVTSCFGCHVQAESVLGLARSTDRCFDLPTNNCEDPQHESPLEFAAEFLTRVQRKDCILGRKQCGGDEDPNTKDGYFPNLGSIGFIPECGANINPQGGAGPSPVMQTVHGGLGFAGYTRHIGDRYGGNLADLADWLLTQQSPEGAWHPDRYEPPVDQGSSFATGAAVLAIQTAATVNPSQSAEYEAATQEAVAWTRTANHDTTQDLVFSIVTMIEGGVDPTDPDLQSRAADLAVRQLPDGGWGERLDLESNAYGTGQAVFGLIEAGIDLDSSAICDGVTWLLDHQQADGSWSMGETGVSTGSTRNSSFTATVWPVNALSSLDRFGAGIVPAFQTIETCEAEMQFMLDLANTAGNPCRMFDRFDQIRAEASAVNGQVELAGSPATLNGGESAPLEVSWSRPAGPLEDEEESVITLRAYSSESELQACPRSGTAEVRIVGKSDRIPVALGPTLRLRREANAVLFQWEQHHEEVGSFDLLRLVCSDRSGCSQSPDRDTLDALSPVRTPAAEDLASSLPDDAAFGEPELIFYKLRGTSPCKRRPGPTCRFDCAEPRCNTRCL